MVNVLEYFLGIYIRIIVTATNLFHERGAAGNVSTHANKLQAICF